MQKQFKNEGKFPENTVLDTAALINLLKLETVSDVEACIVKNGIKATHFMSCDRRFIYDSGIDGGETQWDIEDFGKAYPDTWWTVEQVIHR